MWKGGKWGRVGDGPQGGRAGDGSQGGAGFGFLRLMQLPPPAGGAGPHHQSRWSGSQTPWIDLWIQTGIKRCHPRLPTPPTALGKVTSPEWNPSGGPSPSLAFQLPPDPSAPIKSRLCLSLFVCSHWKHLPEDLSVWFGLSLGGAAGHTSGQSAWNCKVSFFSPFPSHFTSDQQTPVTILSSGL